MPSGNGQNAADAMTAPRSSSFSSAAFSAAIRVEYTRLIWPAPTPMVAPPRANTIAFDFTNLATCQANSRSASSRASGRLQRRAAGHGAKFQLIADVGEQIAGRQQAQIRLGGERRQRFGAHAGGRD